MCCRTSRVVATLLKLWKDYLKSDGVLNILECEWLGKTKEFDPRLQP